MQGKINSFRAAFVDLAADYVKRVAVRAAQQEPEAKGAAQQFRYELANDIQIANTLAETIEKMQKNSGRELPQGGAADKLGFLRDFLEGKTRWNFPEGTVFNVNTSTGDGAAVQLKPEADGEPEPPAGPHLRFQNGRVRVADGTEAEEQGSRNIAILKNLCGYCRALAKNSGAVPPEREWATDAAALEFAISILSELREIKEVRIPAEPNTPGAWELMRDILAGKRLAPEGTVFDVVIDMTGNPQAIRSREEPEPAPRALAIAMPGGETVKLNSAAEAYRLAGCIEEMAARVWPKVKPDAPQDKPGE